MINESGKESGSIMTDAAAVNLTLWAAPQWKDNLHDIQESVFILCRVSLENSFLVQLKTWTPVSYTKNVKKVLWFLKLLGFFCVNSDSIWLSFNATNAYF